MGRAEFAYYEQDSLALLKVQNPHFNVVNTYNLLLQLDRLGKRDEFKFSLFEDFFTAIAEDVLVEGDVGLAFFKDETSWDGLKLTHPSYRHSADIVRLTLNGAKKRRDEGDNWERQYWEIWAGRKIRRWLKSAGDGEMMLWQLPADTGGACGYDPVSFTYIYRVEGEGNDKRIEVKYFKTALSVKGNNRVREIMEVSRESGERELIANPVEVGIKSFDEVRNVIKDVESEGGENLVSGLVDQVGRLTPEAFKAYGEQIEESVKFLNKAILGEYHLLRRNLDQAAVERLEVTYSFARRAVENFEKTSNVVDAQVIEQDYKIQLEVRQEAIRQRLKWGGVNEQLRLQAIMLEQEMVERYGRLDEMLVGGRGCPRGVMVGLELGLAAPTLADLGKAGYVGGGEVDGMVCPNCGAHLPRGNGDTCGHCGMTKDRWATISGTKCD